MATVTSPIILDSTGQDIKTSIDLLTANINRTASNIPYDNNLTIKGKIDAIDLTSGGTINGSINIERDNANSAVVIGKGTNSSEFGRLLIYDKSSHYATIRTVDNLGANREFSLPSKEGTIALTSDSLPLKSLDSSGGVSKTYEILSGTVYLMILGQSGGSGSMLLNASIYLVSRPTNNGTDISYQPLVTGGRTITSATMSGNTATFNFSGTARSSIFQVATFL